MKKTLVMVLMVVAIAIPSKAQVKFGLQAGLNMTNPSVKDIEGSLKSRTGFFVGPTVQFSLPLIGLGFDASALYDQREGKASHEDGSTTLKAQSIQIPINVRYGFGMANLAEVFLFAGPQFGFNIGSDKTLSEEANIAKSTWTLKSSNLSANVGLGATILGHVQAKINYNFALSKTGEFKLKDFLTGKEKTEGNAKFNTWQVSVAYLF
ncbi:MAG: porin family protein [Prevotella sp.]|nr:porin family protein [Prevotella sp.]